VAAAGLGAAGCGGGSSTPAYCTARANLESTVQGLTNLNVHSGIGALESQLKKIETDAAALVSAAKGDYPSETSAIKSSVNSLKGAVKNLSSDQSAANIATVTSDAAAVVSSVSAFTNTTKSQCSS
jgi:hypothetical protein